MLVSVCNLLSWRCTTGIVLHLADKISSEPHGINTTLPLWETVCPIRPRITFALFFIASHWQLMLVPCLLLPIPLASYKLFSKKLSTPSGRACTLGKQKVQFRVPSRSFWCGIFRFPQHSYFVSKDPSWKPPLRVTCHSLFHCFSSLLSTTPLIFPIFPSQSCASLSPPTFYNVLFRCKAFVFFLHPSFCPLYLLFSPIPLPWVSAETPKFRVKGILFHQLFAGEFPGTRVQIS